MLNVEKPFAFFLEKADPDPPSVLLPIGFCTWLSADLWQASSGSCQPGQLPFSVKEKKNALRSLQEALAINQLACRTACAGGGKNEANTRIIFPSKYA